MNTTITSSVLVNTMASMKEFATVAASGDEGGIEWGRFFGGLLPTFGDAQGVGLKKTWWGLCLLVAKSKYHRE